MSPAQLSARLVNGCEVNQPKRTVRTFVSDATTSGFDKGIDRVYSAVFSVD